MSDVLDEGIAAFDREHAPELGTDEATDTGTDTTAADIAGTEETSAVAAEAEGTPARDPETGQFVAKEAPAQEADPKFESYLQRFGADPAAFDDLAPELQKALRAGFEADGMTGRQGQQLGELQKTLEAIQAQTAPQPEQQAQYDLDAVTDHFAEHPESILPTIQQAYDAKDMTLVFLAIDALEDLNPVLAKGLMVEIAKREMSAEMSPHIERTAQQDFNTNFSTAWNTVKATHPDIDQFADQILAVAQQDPVVLRGLEEGTPESTARVLSSLYKIAAFDAARQDGSTLTQAQAAAQAEQAAETDAAKREGFVATGAQRVDTEPLSEGEQWLQSLGVDDYLSKHGYAPDAT